jgi:hypothetical protein
MSDVTVFFAIEIDLQHASPSFLCVTTNISYNAAANRAARRTGGFHAKDSGPVYQGKSGQDH